MVPNTFDCMWSVPFGSIVLMFTHVTFCFMVDYSTSKFKLDFLGCIKALAFSVIPQIHIRPKRYRASHYTTFDIGGVMRANDWGEGCHFILIEFSYTLLFINDLNYHLSVWSSQSLKPLHAFDWTPSRRHIMPYKIY